jgi:predicted transcriptional regulator
MASGEYLNIAMLSIKPEYVELICSGDKKVEFRKRKFARKVSQIVIYATAPVKKVVAAFKVKRIREGSPVEIWDEYNSVGGIDTEAYSLYYSDSSKAVAIEIGNLNVLPKPLSLNSITGRLYPPQSYYYISKYLFHKFFSTKREEQIPERGTHTC